MTDANPPTGRDRATGRLNHNQFDEEGLPGIDENYPPEHSWGVEDPNLVEGDANTPDDLATRVSREVPDATATEVSSPVLMDPDSGDPGLEGDVVDDEKQMLADTGSSDPDSGLSAEEQAMHIVDGA